MNYLICDDEILAAKSLEKMLSSLDPGCDTEIFSDVSALGQHLSEACTRPDCIFMDIALNEDGKLVLGTKAVLGLSEKLPDLRVVYVTGYPKEYAHSIFTDVRPFDFLVKPVNEDHLRETLERLKAAKDEENAVITVQNRGSAVLIHLDEIIYINSSAHSVIVHLTDGEITLYNKLSRIEAVLPDKFVKCHKSFVVNLDKIVRINGWNEIEMKGGYVCPISRSYREKFKDKVISRSSALI